MIFNVSFILLVIINNNTIYYNYLVSIIDIRNGFKMLLYSFDSTEAFDVIKVSFNTAVNFVIAINLKLLIIVAS